MDVDVSIFRSAYSEKLLKDLETFDVKVANGILQVAADLAGMEEDVELEITEFLRRLESTAQEVFAVDSMLEIAYYYDADKFPYFSATFSPGFLEMIGCRKLQLKVIGYPCAEEEPA